MLYIEVIWTTYAVLSVCDGGVCCGCLCLAHCLLRTVVVVIVMDVILVHCCGVENELVLC